MLRSRSASKSPASSAATAAVQRHQHDLLVVVERAPVEVRRADDCRDAVHDHDLGVHHRRLEVPHPHAAAGQLVVRGLAGELADPLVRVRTGQQHVHLDAALRGRAQPVEEEVVRREVRRWPARAARSPSPAAPGTSTAGRPSRSRPTRARPGPRSAGCCCCGNESPSSYSSRPLSAQFCANAARSPSTAGPRTSTWVSRHSRSSRASPHHSSAMPTPPVNAICSSTTSTFRWQRWFCLSGEFSQGLRNHSTCTPASSIRSTRPFSICRPPTRVDAAAGPARPRRAAADSVVGEPGGDVALPVDVRHQVDAALGLLDRREHRREDPVPVAQHGELVALGESDAGERLQRPAEAVLALVQLRRPLLPSGVALVLGQSLRSFRDHFSTLDPAPAGEILSRPGDAPRAAA